MKRLFTVIKLVGSRMERIRVGDQTPPYFDNKQEAKKLRNSLNEQANGDIFRVTRGPDHIGSHGDTIRHRKHRTNKRRKQS